MLKPALWRRLKRLENGLNERLAAMAHQAVVETLEEDCAERHVVLVHRGDADCWYFQEQAGLGPQLADFGFFDPVVYFNHAEMNC